MAHHLVSEGHLKTFCIYCRREVSLDKWRSEWHSEAHYKTTKCSCGRDLHIKVDFQGSGHDSWNGSIFKSKVTKKGNIEDRIKAVDQPKVVERHYPKK